MRPYPPLGILYISAYLKQKGEPCEVFDSTFSTLEGLKSHLRVGKPRYLGLYVNLMTKLNILAIMQFVRSEPSLKHCRIIVGGPEVRHHATHFIESGADAVVIGEGEETFFDLINTWDIPFNAFLDQVPGIVFRNGLGEIVTNPEREKIKDLDQLPMPDREAIDLVKYLQAWKGAHGLNAVSISSMRGCPYTCNWCSRAVYGLSYRRRSASKVVEEIAWVNERYAPDTFWFVDDVFTVSHKWLAQFKDALQEKGVKLKYECITRADRMNAEVVEMLAETGCFRVWIGAESGSQKILDAMDRRVKVEQVREMIQLAQQKGIQAGTFIMLGYPGETEADIEATIDHLAASDPNIFTITVAYPITGTPLFAEVEPHLLNRPDWETSTDRDLDFKRTYPRIYYDYAVRRVVNEVEYRKALRRGKLAAATKRKVRSLAAKMGMWWHRKPSGKAAL